MKATKKTLSSRLFSVYALSLFFAHVPFVLVYYLVILPLPVNTRLRLIYKCHRLWMWNLGKLTGIDITVKGAEKLDPKQTYVFVVNHSNLFDIVMAGSQIQHSFMPLAKKEMLKIPGIGWLFQMASIPVDRSSKQSRQESFDNMIKAIQQETSVLIFPEGTRNRTDKPLKDFYDGAFNLAITAQVPIMPIVLLDVRNLQPVDSFTIHPGAVSLVYLDPIPTTDLTEADLPQLKQQVYDLIWDYLMKHDSYFRA